MKEYKENINYYINYWWSSFTQLMPESEWGNIELAEIYLEKYWLPMSDYKTKWQPIKDQIFINQEKSLPNILFKENYNITALRGGSLFSQKNFEFIQKCLMEMGDNYFVVVENTYGQEQEEPTFRLKFPTDIRWEELMSGNYISSVVFDMSSNEYFVFGESDNWGYYAASDYNLPLNILGMKPEYLSLFKKYYPYSKQEWQEIKSWLPESYVPIVIEL